MAGDEESLELIAAQPMGCIVGIDARDLTLVAIADCATPNEAIEVDRCELAAKGRGQRILGIHSQSLRHELVNASGGTGEEGRDITVVGCQGKRAEFLS